MVKKMRVIISAGGTGGHIYPALAIINKIKEEESGSEILYIGTTDRMEKDLVPSLGYKYEGLEVILQSIYVILNTPKGSRVWQPEFGCGVMEYIWDLADEKSISKILMNVLFHRLHIYILRKGIKSTKDTLISDSSSIWYSFSK